MNNNIFDNCNWLEASRFWYIDLKRVIATRFKAMLDFWKRILPPLVRSFQVMNTPKVMQLSSIVIGNWNYGKNCSSF